MNIFDNIGCEFVSNGTDLKILGALPGYNNLSIQESSVIVPYLARNIIDPLNIEYEVGTATIKNENAYILIKDRKVITSSNNNKIVDFKINGKKEFYIFVNTSNFNTAFNNISFENKNFKAQKKKTLYIVDISSGYIKATLPNSSECEALELQFKASGEGSLSISDNVECNIVLKNNEYISLVSTGKSWVQLKDEKYDQLSVQSDEVFRALSDPVGDDRSIQYKDGSVFAGSLIYIGNNNKVLFGSSTESDAKHIISPTGNNSTVFNQTKDGSSFIVYGSGNPGYPEKNLYFSSDGRLGINMPSGVNTGSLIRPATVFHVVNTFCQEGIRLENRTTCNPADITLYNNPSTLLNDKNTIGQISFKAKNSSSNKITYSQIKSVADSVSSSKGQLDFVVNNNNSGITTISTNPDYTTIRNQNSLLSISGINAEIRVNNNILISGTSINILAGTGSVNNSISISGSLSANNEFKLPYINQTNVLLGIDGNKRVVAATGFKIPGIAGDGKRKILTTEPDGTVVATSQLDSFWPYEEGEKLGGKDMTWSRYPYRSGEVCVGKTTKELQLLSPAPEGEYSVNDQIAIEIFNGNNNTVSTIYRNINELILTNNTISALLVDEDISITEQSTLKIYSVSKGGVLTNTIYTSGVLSDATANVLSTRPDTPTVFNTLNKNIDFKVYGSNDIPALNILASASLDSRNSGVYFKYATQFVDSSSNSVSPQQTSVGSNGAGVGNSISNNSVNYNEAADAAIWSNGVTSVGTNGKSSYYGTYDQNGNVYEWVEDSQNSSSSSSNQYICGGSWRSPEANSLRSYISTPRFSGFDDIGFRICSKAGFSNNTIDSLLNLTFVRVDDINNIPDETSVYTESYDNRFNIKASPDSISVQNLGVVNYSYNIGKFEITNNQYATFLNTVATGSYPNGLYRTEMASSDAGGILQSGNGTNISPYIYYVKENMGNMPVVYVEYLSAIRFVNWINNLSKEYSTNDLENGSYSIYGISQSVTKYDNQNYWLPSLNEWHKAAYYMPMNKITEVSAPSVTIKRSDPFRYETNKLSSLSISGHLYADGLQIGTGQEKTLQTKVSGTNFQVNIGPDNVIVDDVLGTFSNIISNTGITFVTNGSTLFINRINPTTVVKMTPAGTHFYGNIFIGSGLTANNIHSTGLPGGGMKLTPSGLEYIDVSGNTVPGGMFPGDVGGFLYKQTDSVTNASSKLISIDITGVYYPKLVNTNNYEVIHNNDNGVLSSSSWFRVGYIPPNTSDIGEKVVSITSTGTGLGAESPVLYTDRILIGPPLEGYAGSILTHNGLSPATWQQNDFFKAPGALWTRYGRRSVEILDSSKLKFTTNLTESQGGTGQVGLNDIENEFAYNETIALVNQDREVFYVKVSNIDLTDAYAEDDKSLWSNETDRTNLVLTICPPLPEEFISNSILDLADSPMNGKPIAYAFSVQKGAYMDMEIEPDATTGFNCLTSNEVPDSDYRFKPSTKNTFSIRPNIHTAFNKLADDIDFVVYGHRKTLFTRYEPEWFDTNANGIPVNLIPAFRIHAHIDNSVEGNIESGIFRDTIENNSKAINIKPDLYSKITVNMHEPYKIATLTGIKIGIINPGETIESNKLLEKEYGLVIDMASGVAITGLTDISKYADLSINGTTYTSGLITKDIVLTPIWQGPGEPDFETASQQKIYAPNYPLTINSKGQIVSLIPPPQPEPPGPPLNLTGSARNQSIILDWDEPEKDGGDPIVDYIIEFSDDSGATWTKFEEFGTDGIAIKSAITSRTIRGLNNNVAYIFRIYAVNGIGIGPVSEDSSPITPINNGPTVPRNLAVTGQDDGETRPSINVVLTWNDPLSKGLNASTVTYSVDYLIDIPSIVSINNASWTPVTSSNISEKTITIQNIDQSKYVYFRVIAHNNLGHQSDPAIYRSIGTGDDPRVVGPSTPTIPNQYDFGTIICSGVCL